MSIGDTLAEARRRPVYRDAGQRADRIRETIIRGIEQSDFSACGGDFYARGHIRSIAAAVGVRPEPLIHEYDEAHGAPPSRPAAADGLEPAAPLRIKERRSLNWSVAMILALLVVVGIRRLPLRSRPGRAVRRGKTAAVAPHATTTHADLAAHHRAAPSPRLRCRADAVIQLTAVEDCWVVPDQRPGCHHLQRRDPGRLDPVLARKPRRSTCAWAIRMGSTYDQRQEGVSGTSSR